MKILRIAPVVVLMLVLLTPLRGAYADAGDFKITSFEADYFLTRDSNKTSHMKVKERLVAEFPTIDQNHGILRAIPEDYAGHTVHLKDITVTDDSGRPVSFTTSVTNANQVLRIGDPGKYVHGSQAYNIDYDMTNVTANPTGHDALFWDINGTGWTQNFGKVTGRIHLSQELASLLKPEFNRCFTGANGSTASDCTLSVDSKLPEPVIQFTTTRILRPAETLTAELGFASETFSTSNEGPTETKPSGWAFGLIIPAVIFFGFLPPIIALFIVIKRRRRFGGEPQGRGVIVPEYTPPTELTALASGIVLTEGFSSKAVSAQIMDFAVRGYVKVYEVPLTGHDLELIHETTGLKTEELSLIQILFGQGAAIGTRIHVNELKYKLHTPASELSNTVMDQLVAAGTFSISPQKAKRPFLITGIVLLVVGAFMFVFGIGVGIAGIIFIIASLNATVRTAKGVDQRDYLYGLRMYMQMAEADRINAMQSPNGALTEKIQVTDRSVLVKLSEKLLPYAMLFNIEKQWAKEFAPLYEQPPDWYVGTGAFETTVFAESLGGFCDAVDADFSPQPSSSSSSGGSAGGGGGGGGGGGW